MWSREGSFKLCKLHSLEIGGKRLLLQRAQINLSLVTSSLNALFKQVISYLGKPFLVHMVHHYYFTVKGNWGATRARGEKKVRYHLQVSHQKLQNAALVVKLTVALPKLWLHVSNGQVLHFREKPSKQRQPTALAVNSSENCSCSCLHMNSGTNPPVFSECKS